MKEPPPDEERSLDRGDALEEGAGPLQCPPGKPRGQGAWRLQPTGPRVGHSWRLARAHAGFQTRLGQKHGGRGRNRQKENGHSERTAAAPGSGRDPGLERASHPPRGPGCSQASGRRQPPLRSRRRLHTGLSQESRGPGRPGVCPTLKPALVSADGTGSGAPGPAEAGNARCPGATQGRTFRGSAGPVLTGCVLCHTEVMTTQTPAL